MESEGAYKIIEPSPLLHAGIQIKADDCPIFSWIAPAVMCSPPPDYHWRPNLLPLRFIFYDIQDNTTLLLWSQGLETSERLRRATNWQNPRFFLCAYLFRVHKTIEENTCICFGFLFLGRNQEHHILLSYVLPLPFFGNINES